MPERRVKPVGKMKYRAEIKRREGVLIPELEKVSLATSGDGHPGGADCIHPSEMAKSDWCPRSTYYRITTGVVKDDDSFSFVLENIFDEGHSVEAKWQARMRQTGKLWGEWGCHICNERTIGWEPGLDGCKYRCGHFWKYLEVPLEAGLIRGREDGALFEPDVDPADMAVQPYMVEIKTIGLGTVRHDAADVLKRYYVETVTGDMIYDLDRLWKDLKHPFNVHVRQANVYLWQAEQMGLPFTTVRFLYEYKFNQQVKEFSIKKSDKVLEPMLAAAREIEYAVGASLIGNSFNIPECPLGGCKYCKAYEEEKDAGAQVSGQGGTQPVSRRGVQRIRAQAGGAGNQPEPVGQASRVRTARRASRSDRGARSFADEPVPGSVPVAQVPGRAAGSGGSGRVVHRKRGNAD